MSGSPHWVTVSEAGVARSVLGSWAQWGQYYNSTRSSDFMPDHYRAFAWASGDSIWNDLVDSSYTLINMIHTNDSSASVLLPDFIQYSGTLPQSA